MTALHCLVRIEVYVVYVAAVVYSMCMSTSYSNEYKRLWHIPSMVKS